MLGWCVFCSEKIDCFNNDEYQVFSMLGNSTKCICLMAEKGTDTVLPDH